MDIDAPDVSYRSYINVDGTYWRPVPDTCAEEDVDGVVDHEEEAMMQCVHAMGYDDLDEMEEDNVLLRQQYEQLQAEKAGNKVVEEIQWEWRQAQELAASSQTAPNTHTHQLTDGEATGDSHGSLLSRLVPSLEALESFSRTLPGSFFGSAQTLDVSVQGRGQGGTLPR